MAATHERRLPECSQEAFGAGTQIRKMPTPQECQQTGTTGSPLSLECTALSQVTRGEDTCFLPSLQVDRFEPVTLSGSQLHFCGAAALRTVTPCLPEWFIFIISFPFVVAISCQDRTGRAYWSLWGSDAEGIPTDLKIYNERKPRAYRTTCNLVSLTF